MTSNTDTVLIVGGGPVGLVLASFLSLHGIPSSVFERSEGIPKDLRASTFHPPTLDMLEQIGVTKTLVNQGLICPTWQFRDRQEGEVATFDLSLLKNETNHPYRLQCEQWKLATALDALADTDDAIDLNYAAEVIDIAQDDGGASLTVQHADGSKRHHRGRYVIGADGANSVVRKSTGIRLEGTTIPELFLTMSTDYRFEDAIPNLANIAYITDPDEWVVLLRTPTLWRIMVPTDPDASEADMYDKIKQDARIQALCPKDGIYEIEHSTAYRVQQRVADRYFSGRALLAGDSAHLNNPLGGMGLNGGVHDAINLVDKIRKIYDGAEAESMFGLYERQRRQVCVDTVQQQSIRNRKMMAAKTPQERKLFHDDMRAVVADDKRHHEFVLKSSMIASLRDAEAIN